MSKAKVTVVEGIQYKSASDAVRELIKNGGKSIKEAAELSGVKYATAYAVTKGKDKVDSRHKKYQAVKLAKSTRNWTKADISKRTGIKPSTLHDLFKRMGIVPVSVVNFKSRKKKVVESIAA